MQSNVVILLFSVQNYCFYLAVIFHQLLDNIQNVIQPQRLRKLFHQYHVHHTISRITLSDRSGYESES